MLQLVLPSVEGWDENREEFVTVLKEQKLTLEHSLVSISKWESKWHKPFLTNTEKSQEEIVDYMKCMTITQNVSDETYLRMNAATIARVNEYIADSMTATTFRKTMQRQRHGSFITSELIYYWMFSYQIPIECEKWHLNRLLTLIRIFSEYNKPKKKNKVNQRELADQRNAINESRRKMLNSKG